MNRNPNSGKCQKKSEVQGSSKIKEGDRGSREEIEEEGRETAGNGWNNPETFSNHRYFPRDSLVAASPLFRLFDVTSFVSLLFVFGETHAKFWRRNSAGRANGRVFLVGFVSLSL